MSRNRLRLPEMYYIAPNGAKIKIKTFTGAKLTNIEVHEPRMDVALTNELNAKGSISVTFKYGDFKCDEVSK
jgi:hypothetical protein